MDPFLSFIPTACAEGHFGKNCSFSCKCKNGASCDPVNGNCRCPPGVSGDLCQDGETLLFVSSLNAGFPAKIKSNYFKGTLDILHLQRSIFLVQVVLKASMGSSATRSVIVPIMDGATAPTERACVTPDSTDASVISVSPTAYASTASHAELQITKGQACCYFHCDLRIYDSFIFAFSVSQVDFWTRLFWRVSVWPAEHCRVSPPLRHLCL